MFGNTQLGFPEESGDNPPSLFQYTFFRAADPLEAKQPHSIILPPPSLTVVFLGLKASPSLLQNYCYSLWPNNSSQSFPLEGLFFPMWSAADFSQSFRCQVWIKVFLHGSLSAHVDVKHTWLWTLTSVFQQPLVYCIFRRFWFTIDHAD